MTSLEPVSAAPHLPSAALRLWVGVGTVIVATGYLLSFSFRGWWPQDDGMLCHAAERVLRGEWPHRDFDEVYTGGLTLLNALAMWLWGVNLAAPRIMLVCFAVPFIATTYLLALRSAPPLVAMLVTWLAVAWSLPNYTPGLANWYNLFFATFGAWALVRHLDTGKAGWLFLAGVFGGLSVVIKIVGLYYLAAAVLYLIDRERRTVPAEIDADGEPRSRGFAVIVSLALGLFVVGLILLVRDNLGFMQALYFVVPGAVWAGVLIDFEWRFGHGRSSQRLARLLRLMFVFFLGASVPIGLFLAPYAAAGSLDDVYRGVLILPLRRLTDLTHALPPAYSLLAAVPMLLLLIVPIFHRVAGAKLLAYLAAGALAAWLVASGDNAIAYVWVWNSIRSLPVVLTIAAAVQVLRAERTNEISQDRRSELLLMAALAAMVSIVQYPFGNYVYFYFFAPLVVLSAALIFASQGNRPRALVAVVGAFYLLFAVVWLNRCIVMSADQRFLPEQNHALLDFARGGVSISPGEHQAYMALREAVQEHSEPGSYIYAAPDSPEVYFLTNRKNPTRTIYDLFDDPEKRVQRILTSLDEQRVSTVVLNRFNFLFTKLDPKLESELEARFPHARDLYWFRLRWRDRPPGP